MRCLSLGQDARLMAGKCALQLLARLWRCVERDKERGMVHWLQHCALVRRDGFERGPIGSAHREDTIVYAAECAARWIASLICGFVRKFIRSLARSSMSFVVSSNVRLSVLLKFCSLTMYVL